MLFEPSREKRAKEEGPQKTGKGSFAGREARHLKSPMCYTTHFQRRSKLSIFARWGPHSGPFLLRNWGECDILGQDVRGLKKPQIATLHLKAPHTYMHAYIHIYIYIYIYTCIHVYIYTYMLWCYYLGQVWPFEVLLSGPSLFFTKHCLSKNTIKIGVSALFF